MQGLADTFILLGLPFDSEAAKQLNKEIFETIYFAALETSCALAAIDGAILGIGLASILFPEHYWLGMTGLLWRRPIRDLPRQPNQQGHPAT